MRLHAAYSLSPEDLDIVVIEDSKPMQTILRSMLLSFRIKRLRVFDSVNDALGSMTIDPPNLILTDWRMRPTSGYQMLRLIRHRRMEPLCFVPVLFVTAHGTRPLVDKVLRGGAHHILVKPVAPSTLWKRLLWLLNDARPFVLDKGNVYNIRGIDRLLDDQAARLHSLAAGRIQTLIARQRGVAGTGLQIAPEIARGGLAGKRNRR
ncbi:PleD family two-component system response regulator [Roseibium sp. RKSG952]|uniref:response regulator n=1 Tax=Roseibium sp. RKSG952 TaxID=2529384 RepID=UPI0012BCFC6F|nr:response regulator [Roseibium sp. RKSG952]MTH95464.1 response regulator [Roseibium sp. RKSG952]